MVKRTSMLLETDLVTAAAEALGTTGTSETVRTALEASVRAAHLRKLATIEFPDDAPQRLAELRAPRTSPG